MSLSPTELAKKVPGLRPAPLSEIAAESPTDPSCPLPPALSVATAWEAPSCPGSYATSPQADSPISLVPTASVSGPLAVTAAIQTPPRTEGGRSAPRR